MRVLHFNSRTWYIFGAGSPDDKQQPMFSTCKTIQEKDRAWVGFFFYNRRSRESTANTNSKTTTGAPKREKKKRKVRVSLSAVKNNP